MCLGRPMCLVTESDVCRPLQEVSWSSRVFGRCDHLRSPLQEVCRPLQDVSWSSCVFGRCDRLRRCGRGVLVVPCVW